jgi:hypothetical protein
VKAKKLSLSAISGQGTVKDKDKNCYLHQLYKKMGKFARASGADVTE